MINIEESEKFNEISSYLESLKEKFDEYEKKLLEIKSKIGYDPIGEINEAYEKAASKVKEKVSNLKNEVTNAINHLNTSLILYNMVDDDLRSKLNSIIDDIYNDNNYNVLSEDLDDEVELTESKKNEILLSILYSTSQEMPEELMRQMLNESEYLTDEDKEYIKGQLDIGNIRSSMGYILTKQAEQELEAIRDKNESKIKEYKTKIADIQIEYYNQNPNDDGIYTNDEIKSIQSEIEELKREITNQQIIVNQYKNSTKEWEYDCYLKKVGTDEFESKLNPLGKYISIVNDPIIFSMMPASERNFYNNKLKYFDEDHKKVYYYLLATEGNDSANKYIDTFSDYFNKCSGLEKANEAVNRIINGENINNVIGDLTSYKEGTVLGVENWIDNVGNLFSTTGRMTDSEYAIMYVNNILGSLGYLSEIKEDDLTNIGLTKEQYNELMSTYGGSLKQLEEKGTFGRTRGEWLQTFFGAGVSTGNMLPSVAASYLTSGILSGIGATSGIVGEVAGKVAGLSTMFLSCASQGKNEALRSGRNTANAWAYGILNGLSEVATEYLIGGVPGVSKVDNWLQITPSSGIFKTVGTALLNTFAIAPLEEIAEEELQLVLLDPLVKKISFGENSEGVSWEQVFETALTTYISTVGLNGVTVIPQTAGTIIKSSTAALNYTLPSGETIEITYGMLQDCIDSKTGEISVDKLNSLINNLDVHLNRLEIIDVSQIDTNPTIERSVDPNVMNMSYKGYDYVYKATNLDADKIQQIKEDSNGQKILIEINNTVGLTSEIIRNLPSNIEVRVLGDYGLENFKGFKYNISAMHTLENVTYSPSELSDILTVIENFEKGVDSSWDDLTKAKYAYDFMQQIKYRGPHQDGETGNATRAKHFDGLANLVVGKSTCQGFAHTYHELCDRMGIKCVEISGGLNDTRGHCFNVITIDGKNYIVDTTREKFNDYYIEVLESNPVGLSEETRKRYLHDIEENNKKYHESGFGIRNIDGQYIFKSRDELSTQLDFLESDENNPEIIDYIRNNQNLDLTERIESIRKKNPEYSDEDLRDLAIAQIKAEYEFWKKNRKVVSQRTDELLEKIIKTGVSLDEVEGFEMFCDNSTEVEQYRKVHSIKKRIQDNNSKVTLSDFELLCDMAGFDEQTRHMLYEGFKNKGLIVDNEL